jgi:hypothetical protein
VHLHVKYIHILSTYTCTFLSLNLYTRERERVRERERERARARAYHVLTADVVDRVEAADLDVVCAVAELAPLCLMISKPLGVGIN